MKILLLTPVISRRELWGQYEKGGGAYFPLGLLYIAGYAKQAGHDVEILDCSLHEIDEEELASHLRKKTYDVIGFGECYTALAHTVFRTVRVCESVQPNALKVVGGVHVTLFPKETLQACPELDVAVSGEGEETFLDLLDTLASKDDFADVKGIAYRDGDQIHVNKPRAGLSSLKEVPVLPYELLDVEKYVPPPSNYKRLPTYGFMVQRGCPFKCSYCDVRVHGRVMRYDEVEKVVEQMKVLKEKFGAKGLLFHDSIMTVNRKFSVRLFERMIEEKLDLSWACFTRVNSVDPELLALMKKAGCWNISFGLESGNDVSLERMHKQATAADAVRAIAEVKAAGIQATGSFILCLPGEDEAMSLNTIEFAKKLKLDTAIFFLPVPFPGTELYQVCKEVGGLKEDITWEDFKLWMDPTQPLWINPLIGKERMVEIYNLAVRDFYLSPSTLFRAARNIRNLTDVRKYATGLWSISDLLKNSLIGKRSEQMLPTPETQWTFPVDGPDTPSLPMNQMEVPDDVRVKVRRSA